MKLSEISINTIRNKSIQSKGCPTTSWMKTMGFIYQHESGIFSVLPLGFMYLNSIKKLISAKVTGIGYNEISMPIITPNRIWKFRDLDNYKLEDWFLAPTSEETFVDLEVNSRCFQYSRNIRKELRPESGLYRTREFIMKDAYMVSKTPSESEVEYNAAINCYRDIFQNLELDFSTQDVEQYGTTTEFHVKGIHTRKNDVIEIGHVFNFNYDIFQRNIISFGIGITRLMHVMVELFLLQNKQLPSTVNPVDYYIVPTSTNNLHSADSLYKSLKETFSVILDDRNLTFGTMIHDAEALKPKTIIIVGNSTEYRYFNNELELWQRY